MSDATQQPLSGITVGVFIASEGTEEVEFTETKEAVSEAGASVDVLSTETEAARTVNNDLDPGNEYEVDKRFADVEADEYDALVVPGGTVGADTLRTDEDAVGLVREHVANGKPIGVICHGPWVLVEADVVEGRTLTSYPSLQTDIRNAGGEWVDEEVVTDEGMVTSRKPDDLRAFCETIVDVFELSET